MPDTKIIIGLSNPKSPTNVGAVMRAAGCFCVDSVLYTGERYDRAVKLNTDTKKISATMPLTAVKNLLDDKANEVKVICVDLVEGASPLPTFDHPEKALYIFGPEDGTIDQSLIDQADAVVYIPTIGCMNLAATVNVVLYDRLAKSTTHQTDNRLIRRSRDNNNKVKVRQ
ncbi:MAG: tRNA(Leu) C34 or U34 (ribose-2'-O)-methylase TrmL [Psychromonas sp.]|jgi:tRNA(Leu) C34 or U34 (ribose-2'-O)-methylase TrmL|uniref:RNA methyltransferase n=1 Tax=Psychromonas sp. TaxID=1884585 RepID=UPI0039E3BF2D